MLDGALETPWFAWARPLLDTRGFGQLPNSRAGAGQAIPGGGRMLSTKVRARFRPQVIPVPAWPSKLDAPQDALAWPDAPVIHRG